MRGGDRPVGPAVPGVVRVRFGRGKVGTMDTELFEEFFRALAMNAA